MRYIRGFRVRLCWLVALLCLSCTFVSAKVKLPTLFSDGMVIQRDVPITIWGVADTKEDIVVTFLKKKYSCQADSSGNWKIILPAQKAGGPYILQVNDITVDDVYLGDVWLCSGQSNMELPVRRVMDMFSQEVDSYENDYIRHIKIPNTYNFHEPQSDISATTWKTINQQDVMNYSALAYFFAKSMYDKTGVPIGIVNASWGGTPVEAWMSEGAIEQFPKYLNDKRRYEDDEYLRKVKELEGYAYSRWNQALYQGDKGLHDTLAWYARDFDDTLWPSVDLFSTAWGGNGLNPINGSHWFRKEFDVTEANNEKEATLRLGCIVDADSVFVNNTFVGTTSYRYPPRIYTIPAGVLKTGKNIITVRLISNGGYPEFVKDKPYKIIFNNEVISLEGNWKYQLGCSMPPAPSTTFFNYKPVGLYNAMIAPLHNLSFKGVVWYQGESNVSQRNEYATLLTAMIADWRNTFNNDYLPFYIVELADFLAPNDPGRGGWAEFRLEQAKVAEGSTNVYLIKNSDLGEWNDIHPLDKKTIGNRVAESAWANMQAQKELKKKINK